MENDMSQDTLTTEFLIEDFAGYLRRKNLAQNTIKSYHHGVQLYFKHFETLTPKQLQAFRELLITDYLPATANQRIHSLNHFLLFLEQEYYECFPEVYQYRLQAVKLPKRSFQDTIISNQDCKKLQRKLKQDGYDFWYFIVRFLVTTGVRVSELTQIKVEHLSCGYLDLYSKGGRIRRIYITDSLCTEALAWCRGRGCLSGFLFLTRTGRPITARGIQFRLKEFARMYHINPDTVYPHSFRHRFAKNFLRRCGDIVLLADLLGHESIETTRIYLTRSSKEQQKLLDEIVTW